MNLTEYLNQKDPQPLSMGEVVLQDNEVQILSRFKPKFSEHYVLVYIPKLECYYAIIEKTTTLRTIDEDGNPKNLTVFSYKLPSEEIN